MLQLAYDIAHIFYINTKKELELNYKIRDNVIQLKKYDHIKKKFLSIVKSSNHTAPPGGVKCNMYYHKKQDWGIIQPDNYYIKCSME